MLLAFPSPHLSEFHVSLSFSSCYKQCCGEDPCRPHGRDADVLQLKITGAPLAWNCKVWASSLFPDTASLRSHARSRVSKSTVLWSHQCPGSPDFEIFMRPKDMKCCLGYMTWIWDKGYDCWWGWAYFQMFFSSMNCWLLSFAYSVWWFYWSVVVLYRFSTWISWQVEIFSQAVVCLLGGMGGLFVFLKYSETHKS